MKRWKNKTTEEKVNFIWFIIKWYFVLNIVNLVLELVQRGIIMSVAGV